MPTHAAGDLLLFFACCAPYSKPPRPPAEVAFFTQASFGTTVISMGYRIAESDSETSGTWTDGITQLGCCVYRGSAGNIVVPGYVTGSANASGSGGTIVYPIIADYQTPIDKWFFGAVGHRQNNTDLEVAPTGMVNRTHTSGTFGEIAMHDTNGSDAAWPTTTYTLTAGTSGNWVSRVIELVEIPYAAGGGSTVIVIED
jgi:hypothetical protein